MLYIKNKQLNKLITLFIVSVLALSACSDDDYSIVPDFEIAKEIDRVYLTNTSIDEGHGSVSWHSSAPDVKIEHVSANIYCFMLPERETPEDVNITMKVRAGDTKKEITKTITLNRLEPCQKYGLGYSLTKEVSNNVDYEWYVDQGDSGPHSLINCGPACAEMVLRWVYPSYSTTAEELREQSGHANWWNTGGSGGDIDYVFKKEGVQYGYIYMNSIADLISELDKGNIAILALDIFYVRSSFIPEWTIDKPYKTSSANSGHFIVAKGYKIVDDEYLIEVYDPWSLGKKYINGQLIGKDRYYRAQDVAIATIDRWWTYALIVAKPDNRRQVKASSNWLDHPEVSPLPTMRSIESFLNEVKQ